VSSTPTAEALTETLNHALTIAPQMKSDARWLHGLAYGLQGRDRDRPTRVRPEITNPDPDFVLGRTHDLGIGDDRARHAYTWAGQLLGNSHRIAGDSVCRLRVILGLDAELQNAPLLPWEPARAAAFDRATTRTTLRLRWLLDHGAATVRDDRTRLKAWSAANFLIAADVEIKRILPVEARSKDRCVNCGGRARKGGRECPACASARLRSVARAAKAAKQGKKVAVAPRNDAAFKAKQRRVERGADFGEEPLPWGRYIGPDEWVPATPHPPEHRAS
jgi:hypothetical protein